jgi:hypothetical protein
MMKAEYSLILRIRCGGLAGFAWRHLDIGVVPRTIEVRVVMALKRKRHRIRMWIAKED